MLIQRIITAIFLLAILFYIIFFASLLIIKLFLLFSIAIMALEWCQMFKIQSMHRVFFVALSVFLFLFTIHFYSIIYILTFIILVNTVLIFIFPKIINEFVEYNLFRIISGIFFVISWPVSFYLGMTNASPYFVFYIFLIAAASDTGGYFIGKYFGKHKIIPKISPNKTYEGILGGFVLAIILYIILATMHANIDKGFYFILTCALVAVSLIGDLSESMYKRLAKVKDSGVLLPGHGGVLDRTDSLSASLPFAVLCYVQYFN